MQSTPTILNETTSKSTIHLLVEHIKSYQTKLGDCNAVDSMSTAILVDFSNICHEYRRFAGAADASEVLEISKEEYLLQFVLPDLFKDLMIVHRDVLLQLQKGNHKNRENRASDAALENLIEESKSVLQNAINFFIVKAGKEDKEVQNYLASGKSIASKIVHQKSPWGVYKEQFTVLLSQFSQITNTNKQTLNNIEIFNEIRKETELVIEKTTEESTVLLKISENAIAVIEAKENNKEILTWIEKSLNQIAATDAKIKNEFTISLESKIDKLESYTMPIGTDEGYLLDKKIDFSKNAKKWMDYNLMPLLIDLWDHNSNITNFIKHSLLNLKSSLNLGKEDDNLIHLDTQLQAYKNTKKSISENIEHQKSIVSQINTMLKSEFLVSNSYNSNEFLDVSIQNSLHQYTTETSNILVGIQKVFKDLMAKFNYSYDKVVLDNPQALIEKAAKCVSQRMFKEANAHYDTLFLNKKFIGDLFLVSRTLQENKLKETVAQWNEGFNKSILLLGDSLSGKSTFIDSVSDILIDQKTIKLQPNSTITIEGRKFKTTKNLKEALLAIKQNSYTSKRILLMDDLELWRDDNHSLLSNARALVDFIETESDNVLVIVSTNPAMSLHLNKRCTFSNAFTTQIDVNKCTLEEICKSVLVRHSATHREVVNKHNEILSDAQIVTNVTKLSKKLNNNIGEVLQAWTYGTTVTESGSILYDDIAIPFPDFFTREEIIILKYNMLYSYSNEKMFKNFTGANFDASFKSSLKRLINNKILLRNEEGFLKINPVVNHDVHQILKYRDIIN